jgi:hypothetical protein
MYAPRKCIYQFCQTSKASRYQHKAPGVPGLVEGLRRRRPGRRQLHPQVLSFDGPPQQTPCSPPGSGYRGPTVDMRTSTAYITEHADHVSHWSKNTIGTFTALYLRCLSQNGIVFVRGNHDDPPKRPCTWHYRCLSIIAHPGISRHPYTTPSCDINVGGTINFKDNPS